MKSGTAEVLSGQKQKTKKNKQAKKQWLTKYHRDTLRLTNTNHTNTMGSVEVLPKDYQFINGNKTIGYFYIISQNEFEDTEGVIWIRKSKNKGQKHKQWSTTHTHKIKDRVTRISLKIRSEHRCSRRVSSSCSTRGTHRVKIVTNPVTTTNGTYLW